MLQVGGRTQVDRGLLAARADEFDQQIRKLTSIRDGLRHASACPAADHMECPKFRRLMGLAVSRAAAKPGTRSRPPRGPGKGGPRVAKRPTTVGTD